MAAMAYGRLKHTCLHCHRALGHSRSVNRCAYAAWPNGNMGIMTCKTGMHRPPYGHHLGHGRYVNRYAKATRWWHWETGVGTGVPRCGTIMAQG